MIKAYKNYWKGYVDFTGRTDLSGFWLAVLAGFIVAIVINIITRLVFSRTGNTSIFALVTAFSVITFLPSLAIMVRRLRDGGKSWGNIFWVFLPIAGPIVLIVKLCAASVPAGASQAGPAAVSSEAPLYRSYQPQANTPAAAARPATPAVSKPVSAPVRTAGSGKVPLSSLRPYHGSGVCDVCNRSLSEGKAYIVPNNVFYASPEYRKYYADMNAVLISLTGQSAEQALRYMQLNDHSQGSAVCENCIHMFAELPAPAEPAPEEKQPEDGDSQKQNQDTFYVFAAKGAAFGSAPVDTEAVIREKAEALRDGYEPAKNMALSVIRPAAWGGTIQSSSRNGIIMSSIRLSDHRQSIRSYLEKAGVDSALIEAGIAESEKKSLILTNPMSGITVIGIPITAGKPVAAADTQEPEPVSETAAVPETGSEELPTHLLVRFDIDKLDALGGAYGLSAGRLLGAAVPSELMEMMIISDGDSMAALRGQEQVYLIDISASGSSPETLKDRILPLIQQNGELMKYTAQPPVVLCSDTSAEPLVISGVVRNGQISGAGGLCASGMVSAWKEKKPKGSFCMHCGTKLPEGVAFCPRCGTKVLQNR